MSKPIWKGPDRRGKDRLSDEVFETVQAWTAPYKLKILDLEEQLERTQRKLALYMEAAKPC